MAIAPTDLKNGSFGSFWWCASSCERSGSATRSGGSATCGVDGSSAARNFAFVAFVEVPSAADSSATTTASSDG
jgi:hypothetical protein